MFTTTIYVNNKSLLIYECPMVSIPQENYEYISQNSL